MKGKSYVARNKVENALRKGDFYATPVSLVTCSVDLFKSVIPANAQFLCKYTWK